MTSRGPLFGSFRSTESSDSRSSTESRAGMTRYSDGSNPRRQIQFRGSEPQIVMVAVDATRDIKISAFQWAIKNVICPGDHVYLVGIFHQVTNSSTTPLKVAIHTSMFQFLGYKEKVDTTIFNGNFEDQLQKEISKKEAEFHNSIIVQNMYKLCEEQGVQMQVRICAGPVLKVAIVKEAVELQANWVILDKHLRKDKKYLMDQLQMNLVLMKPKNQGEVLKLQLDHLKAQEEMTLDASFTWNLDAAVTVESKGFDQSISNSFVDHQSRMTSSSLCSPYLLSELGSVPQFDRYEFSRAEAGISYTNSQMDKAEFGIHLQQQDHWEGELSLECLAWNAHESDLMSECAPGVSEVIHEYDYDRNLLSISRNAHLALETQQSSPGSDSGGRLEPSFILPAVNNTSNSKSSFHSDMYHFDLSEASGSRGSNTLHASSVLQHSPPKSPTNSFRQLSVDHVLSPSRSPKRRMSAISPGSVSHSETLGLSLMETSMHQQYNLAASIPKPPSNTSKPSHRRSVPLQSSSALVNGYSNNNSMQVRDFSSSSRKFGAARKKHYNPFVDGEDDANPAENVRQVMSIPLSKTPPPIQIASPPWARTPRGTDELKFHSDSPDSDFERASMERFFKYGGMPDGNIHVEFRMPNEDLAEIEPVQQYIASRAKDDESLGDELRRILNSPSSRTPTPTRPKTPVPMDFKSSSNNFTDIERLQHCSASSGQDDECPGDELKQIMNSPRSRTPTPTRPRTPVAIDLTRSNDNSTETDWGQQDSPSSWHDDESPAGELRRITGTYPTRSRTPVAMDMSGTNDNSVEIDRGHQFNVSSRQDDEIHARKSIRVMNSTRPRTPRTPTPTRPRTPVAMDFSGTNDNLAEIDRLQQTSGSRQDDESPGDELRRIMNSPQSRTTIPPRSPVSVEDLNSESAPQRLFRHRTLPEADMHLELNGANGKLPEHEGLQQYSASSRLRDAGPGGEFRRILNPLEIQTSTPTVQTPIPNRPNTHLGMDEHVILTLAASNLETSTLERLLRYGVGPEDNLQAELSSLSPHGRRKRATPVAPPLCSVCNHKSPEFGRPPRKFTYAELSEATDGFCKDNFVAEGGFGFVYKGRLKEGQEVAVKQHKLASAQGDNEFCSEVEVLSCAQHRNLVTLIGYCVENRRRLLVYEFVCNGSLDWHLSASNPEVLEWSARQKIAVGAARGLRYLHEECRVGCIVHRDMRPNNILLTHDFVPMVGDFGLARYQPSGDEAEETRVIGTLGYLAPEYASSGQITEKADVYSFGVVLLELITGRKAIDASRQRGETCLTDWARPLLEVRMTHELLDPRFKNGDYDIYELNQMVAAAECCIRKDPNQRPKMSAILRILEGDTNNAFAGTLSLCNPVPGNLTQISYGSMRRQGSLDSSFLFPSSGGFSSRRKSDAHIREPPVKPYISPLPHSAPLLGIQCQSTSSSDKSSPNLGNSNSSSPQGNGRKSDAPPPVRPRSQAPTAEGRSHNASSEKSGSPPTGSSKSNYLISSKRIALIFGGAKPKSKLSCPHP